MLVNTIGAFCPGGALCTAPETLRLMLDVILGPALWLSRAFAPHMQQQGSISSSAARDPGERGRAATARHPANRVTFPEDAMAHAVAPEAPA